MALLGIQDTTAGKVLNTDIHPSLLSAEQISFLLNGDIQDYGVDGQGFFVTNIGGNKKCVEVPEYLGAIKLDNDEYVVFQKPGTISILRDCTLTNLVYASCLNFKGSIEGRYQYVNGDRIIYWIEEGGPVRFLNLDKCKPRIPVSECGTCDDLLTNEFDCDSTLFFGITPSTCVKLSSDTNGQIPNSVIQVAIAYYDNDIRQTKYDILPETLVLFSQNFGHTVNVEFLPCISSRYEQYELVLITHRVDRGTVAQPIGIFDNEQKNISISTLDESRYRPIDLLVLLDQGTNYISANHIAVNNETLVLAGVKEHPTFEYNTSNIESEWVTMRVKAKDASKYFSFQRNEVYAFDITWLHSDGTETRRYHIKPDSDQSVKDTLATPSDNVYEGDECNPTIPYIWEIQDTSTQLNYDNLVPDCNPVEVAYGKFGFWQSKDFRYNEGSDQCELIQYHKFPSENAHTGTALHTDGDCEDPYINILAVRFKNITPPVDCDGNPIAVQGYKIYVSDRTGQETIVANGLFYNVRYETLGSGDISMFQNYPFNDLSPDKFLGRSKITQGNVFEDFEPLTEYYQDRLTFISPDTQYIKGRPGNEIQLYSEHYGPISGEFHDTFLYPKYQLLSPIGRLAGTVVGIVEAREVLYGKPCTTTTVQKICNKLKERTTNTDGYSIPKNDVSGGALVNTLAAGSGTINTRITTDFSAENADYSWTVEGDADCSGGYVLQSLNVSDPNGVNPMFDVSSLTCRLDVETNAPAGTVLTVKLNETLYNITLDENGNGSIEVNGDCEPFSPSGIGGWNATNVDYSFFPECDCTGDTSTVTETTTQTCETKVKLLNEMDWYERFPAMLYYFSAGTKAVTDFLKSITSPTNYAIQYTAVGKYVNVEQKQTQRRRIDFQQYLTPHKLFVNGQRFNNWQQSGADYFELHADVSDPDNIDFSRILLSENDCNRTFDCKLINDDPVQASSYYGSVIRRLPNQYGRFNYQVRQISCVLSGTDTPALFGGDIKISKHYTVRRFPLFTSLPLGLPNNTEFDTDQYFNIANPRFWLNVNQESAIEDVLEDLPLLGNLFYDYNLDKVINYDQCQTSVFDSIFGDWSVGGAGTYLISWLASLVNGFSNPFKLPGKFYTHVTGVVEYWAESKFVGDYREYNELPLSQTIERIEAKELARADRYEEPELFLYNLQNHWQGITPQRLVAKDSCCQYTGDEFRMIFSLRQRESSKADMWRKMRPQNFVELPRHTGKLTVIKEIDENNLFIGFEDASYVTQQDEGLFTDSFNQVYLGSGDSFSRNLRRLSDDSVGYGGIIDKDALVSTRYGLYWYDRKRKKFLRYAGQLYDITNGIQSWINNYLDEPLVAVYDSYQDRIFFSTEDKGLMFRPQLDNWISFTSWGAEKYLQLSQNFLSLHDGKLWINNTNDYQRFYGEYHPFEVELNLKESLIQNKLYSVSVYAEFFKHLEYKHYITDEFFDDIWIYNQLYSTTRQTLELVKPNDSRSNLIQKVTAFHEEDFVYKINNLAVLSTQQPLIKTTDGINYVDSEINQTERRPLQGRYFKLRLRKKTGNTKLQLLTTTTISNQ